MRYDKNQLVAIARKIQEKNHLTPDEVSMLLNFEKLQKPSRTTGFLKKFAVPLSLAFGFLFTAFPREFNQLIAGMPPWTNFSPPVLTGVDYLWDLIGEPVRKANVLYHIPNLILYSFGIFGLKKLFDALDRKTWLDKVLDAQKSLRAQIETGALHMKMKKGHSLLFVGNGDFIGMQFLLNHQVDRVMTVSQTRPLYTKFWNFYDVGTVYEDLKNVILRSSGENAGEYIFFPVKDDQIFLPGPHAYDLSPHKLDILCQNIRTIEKEQKWNMKRIIIVGDKFHKSLVQSEDQKKIVPKSEDIISLESISKKYKNITLLDPTDIVLKKVIAIAKGRKIVFRATKEGIREYKERFYNRLQQLGYRQSKSAKGILTIGYDIFEDQTEQQTLSRKIDDYYPVVLSKNVRDALIRNGYKKEEFLYVPDLVLSTLNTTADEQ